MQQSQHRSQCWKHCLKSSTEMLSMTASKSLEAINITFPSMPGSSKWFLSLRFPHQNPVYASPLPHTRYMPRPFIFLDFITRTILGEEYRSFRSSLCIFLHSPVTPSPLGLNILLNTQFSNNLSLLAKTPYILLCERIFCQEGVMYLVSATIFRVKLELIT